MSEMQSKFHNDVERAYRIATKHRHVIAKIKKHAHEAPERLAERIIEVVPDRLRETRVAVLKAFGLDLADAKAIRNYEASSVAEWQLIAFLATRHQVYSAFLCLVEQYDQDPNLEGVRFAQAACEAFIEATERQLYAVALDFYELQQKLPEEGFPKEELAKVLSGMVAARTGLSGERWDRKGLRGRLTEAGNNPKKQLLTELPAEVLGVFHEMMQASSTDPASLSNEARRRIRRVGASKDNVAEERQGSRNALEEAAEARGERGEGSQEQSPSPLNDYFQTMRHLGEDLELGAAFAAEWLEQMKEESRVSEQQWESLEASIRLDSNKEAAKELGRSAQQVGKEKFEALKKLREAAGF